MNIVIELLQKQEIELEKQLKEIRQALRKLREQPQEHKTPTKLRNRGAQALVLRALYTGSTTGVEIAEAMKMDKRLVYKVVQQLISAKLVAFDGKKNKLTLTEPGKTRGKFFVERPDRKLYANISPAG